MLYNFGAQNVPFYGMLAGLLHFACYHVSSLWHFDTEKINHKYGESPVIYCRYETIEIGHAEIR